MNDNMSNSKSMLVLQETQQQIPISKQPSMVIDLKRNRIRIHMKTLHLLGNPDYVQFMVNPIKAVIAIRSCNAQDYRSEHIRWEVLREKQCCEFYSKYLIKSLRKVCFNWKDNEKYRINGYLIQSENLAAFSMLEYTLLNEFEE